MIRLATVLSLMFAPPAFANQGPQSTPIDRGYGQHDACFGDKYESEDDMKTGNEAEVERLLKQLLNPGS